MLGVHNRDVTNFYNSVRDSEIKTTELLGCKMTVLEREPVFKLQVTFTSPRFEEYGGREGAACKLVFACPKHYPARMPSVEIVEKTNLPSGYAKQMYEEYATIMMYNAGVQLIMPLCTRTQSMIDDLDELPEHRTFKRH